MSAYHGLCRECRRRKWTARAICYRCEYAKVAGAHPDAALTGGRWVPVRGVLRWVEDGAA